MRNLLVHSNESRITHRFLQLCRHGIWALACPYTKYTLMWLPYRYPLCLTIAWIIVATSSFILTQDRVGKRLHKHKCAWHIPSTPSMSWFKNDLVIPVSHREVHTCDIILFDCNTDDAFLPPASISRLSLTYFGQSQDIQSVTESRKYWAGSNCFEF
jgi:hypothetical protein